MTGRLLIFEAGGRRFALSLEQITEVLEEPSCFPLPLAPPFLGRAISTKGCLTPVLDTGMYLGRSASNPTGRVLVMAGEGVNLALQVDRVTDIVQGDTVTGEQPAGGEPFTVILGLPCGDVPLLSPGQLLMSLERVLRESGGDEGHENSAG